MKGHLLERSPGHWAIVLDVKDPSTGKRRRKWHSFRGGKREAQKRLAELITELQQGAYVEPNKQTVAAYFTTWLRDWAPMSLLASRRCGPTFCLWRCPLSSDGPLSVC